MKYYRFVAIVVALLFAPIALAQGINNPTPYVQSTWTPVLTFATPGDLSVVYTTQIGSYTRVGNQVTATGSILTSSFTWTTASGVATITGLPFTSANTALAYAGTMAVTGITKVTYSQFVPRVDGNSVSIILKGNGSGVANANVNAADMPSAGTVSMQFQVTYLIP